jgi:hypothetical protein
MADAFRVCPPFYFISLRIYYNIFVFFCFIYFWFYPGDCDVRSVAGRRSFVCPLCCRFAPGDPPNAAQVLPARHPQSRWHFQGLPDRSRKQILSCFFFLFYFDRLNLFFLLGDDQISIQRAAVWLLDKYYTEFPIYNPFLERLPPRRSRSKLAHSSSFKFYDLDAQNNHGSLNPVSPSTGLLFQLLSYFKLKILKNYT